jgi:hypothetical protein
MSEENNQEIQEPVSEEQDLVQEEPQEQSEEVEASQESESAEEITAEDLEGLVGHDGQELSDSAKEEIEAAQDQVKEASSTAQKQKATKKLEKVKQKYNLKVDGEEIEWEGSEEDVKRELQLARKARKEIQTANELKKEIASLLDLLKTNPSAVLEDPAIGIDVKQFAQEILNQQMEDELKSPEQRAKEELEKEIEELRSKQKQEEEQRKKLEFERAVQKAEGEIEEKFIQALDESELPKSPYLLKRMADVMLTGLSNKKEINPKQALSIVRREMHKDLNEMFSSSPEELVEQLLGEGNVKRFNKYQLSKFKKSQDVPSTKNIKDTGKSSKNEEANEKNKYGQKYGKKEKGKVKVSDWMFGN